MTIRFLNNEPALFIEDNKYGKILVIADLHLGMESELFDSGIIIAPQSKTLFEKIESLIEVSKAEKLVILGDLKHKIPGISFRELKEIPRFIEPLSKKVEVILVKGNHDTELDGLIPKGVEIHPASGLRIGNYGFFHGHAWPKKELLECDKLFTAHIHPTIQFIDGFGFTIVEKVWVKGKMNEKVIRKRYKLKKDDNIKLGKLETVIFPSFNSLISGFPLNKKRSKRKYVGPLMRNKALRRRDLDVFMMDGTMLGKLTKL